MICHNTGHALLNHFTGGGYQSSGTFPALKTGSHVIIVGLFVQLAFFGLFMIVAVTFHWRLIRSPTASSSVRGFFPWRKHMRCMYAASLLIMVRSIFRAVEYIQGFNGYLLSHEAYLYALDATLMLGVMVLFNVAHPSGVTVASKEEGGNRDTLDIHLDRYYHRV